jgi:hypothetical protein
LLVKSFIREPPRGYSDPLRRDPPDAALPAFSFKAELRELRAVAKTLLLDRPVLHMVLGVNIGALGAYGFYAFLPPYFSRAFHLDYTTIGVCVGLAGGVAVGIGILAGGFVADALAAREMRWYALVPGLGGLIATPLYWFAVLQPQWRVTTGLLALAGFFQYASLGPTFGVVQNVVGRRQRATATALLYICLNVFALGGGPLFTGWVIDRFAQADFSQSAPAARNPVPEERNPVPAARKAVPAARKAVPAARKAVPAAREVGGASFEVSCPGGAARATADADAVSACDSTLVRATRRGMQVTLLFFLWASLHYLLASVGIAKTLKAAAFRNAAGVARP